MLTKLPRTDTTDAIPYVPAFPERVVCPPVPPDAAPIPGARAGYYMSLCIHPSLEIDGQPTPGTVPICTRVWVDSGG